MPREILYKEYKFFHPDGYARSTFNTHLLRIEQQLRLVMHLAHKAGDKVFIDFASFAEHYICAVIPTRSCRPRDKALVEGAVKLI
ncbi:MAG: hypothetical protein LIP08_11115 [Bacteroides sp.]|nr:hypothetical protein [Bacteroides sp.]